MQTRASLLLRIRDPHDNAAWGEFVALYAPLLHAYGMRHGLQDADAADLAQDTLGKVMRAAPDFRYEPAKGTFRGWLLTIARNELRRLHNRRSRQSPGSGDTGVYQLLAGIPDPASDDAAWEHDYRLHLFRWAAGRVQTQFRDKTWQAFWRTVVMGEDVESVAQSLQLTAGAVYVARSRVAARIREEIATAEGE